MPLYHFSEDPTIQSFQPRPPVARPEVEPMVWAVDADHAWTYLFPRDCPRILFWGLPGSSGVDCERWLHGDPRGRLACIEWAWFERMQQTTLFRYELPTEGFQPLEGEADAWMLVNRTAVQPTAVHRVSSLFAALDEAKVELCLMPSLVPLRQAWETTLHVSGIRLRNAIDWPAD